MRDPATFEDVHYEVSDRIATITIDRQERLNALRGQTVDELIWAFRLAWGDRDVRVVILTGAGERAFSSGGDTKQRAETGDYGPTEDGWMDMAGLQRVIRDIPKPVIAAVNGVAVGAGHVLHVICDITIAAEHARFGQAGPRVGSFDAGYGAAFLARVVGEKRAREIWYLCRQYDAATAERWGLANMVVPGERLMEEARSWAADIASKSPTAIMVLKHAFNTDTEHQGGVFKMSEAALHMFTATEEGREGAAAFAEKRAPDYSAYNVV
ncbi:MAG: 2-ketocyclohexanecarboxyl-CoA hydrolase [Thermoleophilaceae bacterium]|nr:2-ketocyclohexanecarboxyl-CoA hydrolase [Thermoleophilaceae bacterium]